MYIYYTLHGWIHLVQLFNTCTSSCTNITYYMILYTISPYHLIYYYVLDTILYIHIYPPPCLLGTSGVFLRHVVCPIPHSGIFLNCFKGPQGGLPIRFCKIVYGSPEYFRLLFRHTPFFTFLPQNNPRKGLQKPSEIVKFYSKNIHPI